jgi:hypothetical protein
MSRLAVLVSLILAAATAGAAQDEGSSRVTCRVPGEAAGRVYVLERSGSRWQLTFTSTETRGAIVRLALPGAKPSITGSTVRLAYRNANGGRQVDLTVEHGVSRLDVWVDHGLEVNIEPDLDPRVDLMSTHGPLEGVRCAVEGQP